MVLEEDGAESVIIDLVVGIGEGTGAFHVLSARIKQDY